MDERKYHVSLCKTRSNFANIDAMDLKSSAIESSCSSASKQFCDFLSRNKFSSSYGRSKFKKVLKSGTRDFSCHVVYGKSHFLFKRLFTKHVFEIHVNNNNHTCISKTCFVNSILKRNVIFRKPHM